MYPILLDIGRIKLYTYGLFIALGFIAAIWFSKRNARFYNTSDQVISDLFLVILLSAIGGARLLYVFINFDVYRNDFWGIFKIWNGGLVFYGGFILALITAVWYVRKQQLNVWIIADIVAPSIALGQFFGRLGCFSAGCCFGKVCDLPWAIVFRDPNSLAPTGIPLHPSQL